MYIFGYLFIATAKVLDFILYMIMILVIARAVLSWVSPDPYNPIVRFIHNVTEPVLFRIRMKIPVVYAGIDFSPILVFVLIIFLQESLVKILFRFGKSLILGDIS
jgi:YggT family protein